MMMTTTAAKTMLKMTMMAMVMGVVSAPAVGTAAAAEPTTTTATTATATTTTTATAEETTASLAAQGAVGPAERAPFRMADDGTVFIPGWDDDRASSRPEELSQVLADEFAQPAAHVYRGEVIMHTKGVDTPTLAMPDNAGTIAFYARSIPWHGIHPRVRMTARPTDGSPARVLWEGQIATLTRARFAAPLPEELRGKHVVISFEFLTPQSTAQRLGFYLRRVVMEK